MPGVEAADGTHQGQAGHLLEVLVGDAATTVATRHGAGHPRVQDHDLVEALVTPPPAQDRGLSEETAGLGPTHVVGDTGLRKKVHAPSLTAQALSETLPTENHHSG
ncbi:hypothetical protein NPS01_42050 [Nocardioides psychrotolerans]|nr:hypothetical protein NPS01_42050 [Nocardioides psychrotolerans]